MKILKNIKRCRVCNSEKISLVLKLKKTPIGENFNKKIKFNKLYNLDLFLCKKCGLGQIKQVINPKVLYKDYLYVSSTSVELKKHFNKYVTDVSNYIAVKKNELILDIGSNDGALLQNFKDKGYSKILGVEPSSKIAKFANQKKIKTINSYFNYSVVQKILKKYERPKLITANNVLANVDNVNVWFKNIKKLIKNDGFFVFESSYLKDVVKNKIIDFIYHEHLSIFSIKSVLYLCTKHNLKLVHVEKLTTKGGSLRYYITLRKNKVSINNSVKKLFSNEINSNCFKISTYKNLDRIIKKSNNGIQKILNKYKNKNKILAFGASISCITLLYQLELEDKIGFLLDDNKIKHGMFSPGSNIKVVSPKKIKFSKDKIILILGWRFKKYFLKKYQNNIKGRILNVWPITKYDRF